MNRKPQRFYQRAEVATAEEGEGFVIHLDGRPVRTPGRALLRLPTRAAAEAVAAEWAAQERVIQPRTMPLTGLTATAIDQVAAQREAVINHLLGYAATDVLCYRAAEPDDLVALQAERWQPLLDWAALTLDAPLAVTTGVVPVAQPPAAVAALGRPLAILSDLALTATAVIIQSLGSIILGLALIHRRLDAEEAFRLAFLDELFQVGLWGEDEEAAARRRQIQDEVRAAARLMTLIGWRPSFVAGMPS